MGADKRLRLPDRRAERTDMADGSRAGESDADANAGSPLWTASVHGNACLGGAVVGIALALTNLGVF
jgi:hypothetical protein